MSRKSHKIIDGVLAFNKKKNNNSSQKRFKSRITFSTFDLFHAGHVKMLSGKGKKPSVII